MQNEEKVPQSPVVFFVDTMALGTTFMERITAEMANSTLSADQRAHVLRLAQTMVDHFNEEPFKSGDPTSLLTLNTMYMTMYFMAAKEEALKATLSTRKDLN